MLDLTFSMAITPLGNLDFPYGNDMVSRPHQITQEEEQEVENEAGKKLSRVERRKLARQKRKKK